MIEPVRQVAKLAAGSGCSLGQIAYGIDTTRPSFSGRVLSPFDAEPWDLPEPFLQHWTPPNAPDDSYVSH